MVIGDQLSEIKRCVTFIYIKNEKGEFIPNGTGFLVSTDVETKPDAYVIYLVTAKHILQDDRGKFFETIATRLNRKYGLSKIEETSIDKIEIFTHSDKDVDIALCTLNPDPRVYEFKSISRQMIYSKETIEKLEIAEGDDVFFSGLFESHIGQRKNQPSVRFGRVALMSDEKIEWKEKGRSSKQLDLYLLECQSFGGNSGSPVFFI